MNDIRYPEEIKEDQIKKMQEAMVEDNKRLKPTTASEVEMRLKMARSKGYA